MTYPQTVGYQGHSETSREAARLVKAEGMRNEVLKKVRMETFNGATADEISEDLDIPQSTIAARLRELELKQWVIKTKVKRKTRHNRNAYVYVVPAYFSQEMGRASVKDAPSDIIKLQAEHKRYKDALKKIAKNGNESAKVACQALGWEE